MKYTVYEVADGRYISGQIIDRDILKNHIEGVTIKGKQVEIDTKKFKGNIDDFIKQKGRVIQPDEVTANLLSTIYRVPYKSSSELEIPLPDSELLKVLHYYASNRLALENWQLEQSLDETALLAVGMVIEKWADEIVSRGFVKLNREKMERKRKYKEVKEEDVDTINDPGNETINVYDN